ncbi:MAG: tubulin-like doman-containing protein [Gemmataceae bacterium]
MLQRFRFDLAERYGPPPMIPVVRTLFVDTDQEALDEALVARPLDRIAALHADSVFPARLNRSAHYGKPRLSGRTLTEGWFDQQLLYRIPRGLQTGGTRMFGRLAFLDHYRALMAKIQSELDIALDPASLQRTEARIGLTPRTNRPRVYIVAGLCGGTGSGMFLDLAYALRTRLARMGFNDPEVVGVLMVPPSDASTTPPLALANTFAALTELNHFSRPDTTFVANYDDRNATIREQSPPFSHCFVVQGTAAGLKLVASSGAGAGGPPPKAGSGAVPQPGGRNPNPAGLKPYGAVAEMIRLNLFSEIGRVSDELRAIPAEGVPPPDGVTVGAFGLSGFGWPRAELIARTTRKVARLMLTRWATTDGKRAREVIPTLAHEKWAQLKFEPDVVQGRLQLAADLAADRVEDQIIQIADPLAPRGWLARLPEPGQVKVTIDRLVKLLGLPSAVAKNAPTPVEMALNKTVHDTGSEFVKTIQSLVPQMVNDPQYRLAGTEEMLRQFLTTTDRFIASYLKTAVEQDAKAQAGFERVSQYAHSHLGVKKPTTAEFGESIKQFPRARFQALLCRAVVGIYQAVRDTLAARLADVKKARERLEAAAQNPPPIADSPEILPGGAPRLMPPGCDSISEGVERFLRVITDADLIEIDQAVQRVIDPNFGGVLQACVGSATGPDDVVAAVYEETRYHLDARLGRVDLPLMLAERYRTPGQAEQMITHTFQEAEPAWIGVGPWAAAEVTVVGCPCIAGAERLHQLVQRAIPMPGLAFADTPDDLLVYREWPHVPLGMLTQLGPAAASAYQSFVDSPQGTVHSRLDVPRWLGADEV